MQHLFSPDGERALARIIERQPLLAFDFDGTLAPIVARPGDARISQAVSARLAALAMQLPVAIVTGRSVDDVRGRLGFEPLYIVGNHGAEDAAGGLLNPASAGALEPFRRRMTASRTDLDAAGVTVEDKGHSIALHYRLSRTREHALEVIGALLDVPDDEVRVFGGKLVVNVVPVHAPDKAQAVVALLAQCGATCALFAGDDVNDEPVFAAALPDWVTIRIGRDDPKSKAMFFLDSPMEMAMTLEKILAIQSASHSG